jgi:FkbM family methyltransferase
MFGRGRDGTDGDRRGLVLKLLAGAFLALLVWRSAFPPSGSGSARPRTAGGAGGGDDVGLGQPPTTDRTEPTGEQQGQPELAISGPSETELRKNGLTRLTKILTWPPFVIMFNREPDQMIDQIAKEQFYAPAETRIFYDVLRERCQTNPEWVVDVGANWGYFALYALAMGCKVLMVEPNPMLVDSLHASIAVGGYGERAVLVHGIAGAEKGQVTFTVLKGKSGFSGVVAAKNRGGKPVEITSPVYLLQDLLKANGITKVALLKVDTEGHELDVMTGLGAWDGVIENVVMEIKFGMRRPEKLKMLKKFAEEYAITAYNEDYSPSGQLACAKLKSEQEFIDYPAKRSFRPIPSLDNPPGEDFWMVRKGSTGNSD